MTNVTNGFERNLRFRRPAAGNPSAGPRHAREPRWLVVPGLLGGWLAVAGLAVTASFTAPRDSREGFLQDGPSRAQLVSVDTRSLLPG